MDIFRKTQPQRPVPGVAQVDEARTLVAGVVETTNREREGRARGEKLIPIPARVIQEDYETLKLMGERYAREPSYLVRVAVHIFAEAYRRNPRALG